MESGYSMSKVILTMKEKGVFGQYLVSPGDQGWPVLVQGMYMYDYSHEDPIGYCKTLDLMEDGAMFLINCQKEEILSQKSCLVK